MTAKRRRKRANPAARKTVRRKRRMSAARTTVRRRKRANPAARKTVRRKRRMSAAAPIRRRARRYRRNPRATSPSSLKRARRAILHKKKTALAKSYARRFQMQSNPNGIMDSVKAVIPFGAALYGSRVATGALVKYLGPRMPSVPYQRPIASVAVMVGLNMASKRVPTLKRHTGAIMVGSMLNVVDSLLAAFAPTEVKAMLGMGDIYDGAIGDYLEVGDYVQMSDAPPIDDDITMADYVQVGLEEELGMGVEEELGLEEELGADTLSRPLLGGVAASSMLAPIRSQPMLAPIPARSFTKRVPRAGAGYDKSSVLYGGIFAGGF